MRTGATLWAGCAGALVAALAVTTAQAGAPARATAVSLEVALARGEATQVIDRAGHLARVAGGEQPGDRAEMLNLLGRALAAIGDLPGAALALDDALDTLKGTPHIEALVDNLVARGTLASRRGADEDAERLFAEAARWAEAVGASGRRAAWVRTRLALATDDPTQAAAATRALDSACASEDPVCGGLRALLEARSALRVADATRARHVLAHAEQQLAAAGLDGLRLEALTELVGVHRALGLSRQAAAACDVGLDVARRTGLRSFAPALHRERGEIALGEADAGGARAHLEAALAMAAAGSFREAAATRIALAQADVASGALTEASMHLRHALALCERQSPHGDCRPVWRGLAGIARAQGDATREERWLLALARSASPNHEDWEVWDRLGQLATGRGDASAAVERLGRAADELEVQDALRASHPDPERFREQRLEVYDRLLAAWLGRHDAPADELVGQALAVAERSEARAFLDLIERARLRHGRPEVVELLGRVDRIDAQVIVASGSQDRNAAAQELLKLNHERAALESELRHVAPRLARLDPSALRSRVDQAVRGVKDRISGDAVILKYHLAPKRSWLFVVVGDGIHVLELAGRETIAPLAIAFHESLARPARTRADRTARLELAQALFARLLAPALPLIGTRKRVVVAPHAELRVVPFDALVLDGDAARALPPTSTDRPHFALERFTFNRVPSITALSELHVDSERRRRGDHRHPFVAFADPVYSQGQTPIALPDLAYSRSEATAALRHLGGSDEPGTLFFGASATEAALKGLALSRYQIIHIATHGWAGDALDAEHTPALFLGPGGGDDGMIDLNEVLALELDADLVILSACDSGRGPLTRGAGVGGLTGAFLQAGSSAVMATLWAVDDAHAARLMDGFYGGLAAGVPAAAALRSARLALLSTTTPGRGTPRGIGGILDSKQATARPRRTVGRRESRMMDPFFWASYVLVGDVGDILIATRPGVTAGSPLGTDGAAAALRAEPAPRSPAGWPGPALAPLQPARTR